MIARPFASAAAAALLLLAGCGDDTTGPRTPPGTGKALVLVTFGQQGVTVVGDTAETVDHLDFGDVFDGATFTVRGDTVLTTSSKFAGDLLFVADVGAGTVRTIPLPEGGNPAGVIALPPDLPAGDGADYAVALRDDRAIALVDHRDGGVPATRMVQGAGECPTDVIVVADALVAVDGNQNCRDLYQILGPARLIRMPLDNGSRDTLDLPAGAVSSPRAWMLANGDLVVVTAGDYGDRPGFVSRIAIDDAGGMTPDGGLALPDGWYATASRLGDDGRLYVTAALAYPADYEPRVFAVDPATMTFTGARVVGQQYLDLRTGEGALARCDAATADDDGAIFCVSNSSLTSSLRVFTPAGAMDWFAPVAGLGADVFVR